MSLTGAQYMELTQALVKAFPSESRLAQLLKFRLDKNLAEISLGASLTDIVFDVIGAAEAEGWTNDLIVAARRSNPKNEPLFLAAQTLDLATAVPARPQLELVIKQTSSFLDIAEWRTRLAEIEGRVCRIEIPSSGDIRAFRAGAR